MTQAITFSLDLEDHRADVTGNRRYPFVTRKILKFLEEKNVKGTFFTVGKIADEEPGLIREICDHGHEIAFHSYCHRPLTMENRSSFRAESQNGVSRLEDLIGTKVYGFRAPNFSLTSESLWVVDELREMGFLYSSSVLPAKNPISGFPGAPEEPFYWHNQLLEIPVPLSSFLFWKIPYLGGVYLRYLPLMLIRAYQQRSSSRQSLWTYCHPYDFDTEEPYSAIRDAPLWVSLLLWINRGQTYKKMSELLTNSDQPFIAQIKSGRFANAPIYNHCSV